MERRQTVAIVGVGLIGGSIGLALRARGLAGRVVGVGRNMAALDEARRLGAIDEGTTDLRWGVEGADIVVVCTPVDRIAVDVIECAKHTGEDTLITDAGSTKRAIVAAVEADPAGRRRFVGAHPIAGSERKGVAAARADLFEGCVCVLTPTPATHDPNVDRASLFWASLRCFTAGMTPAEHDATLALTSHLPHAVAAALAAAVPSPALLMAAGAYRDGTRVAAADPHLWAAIFDQNRAPLLAALDAFDASLSGLRDALTGGDAAAIARWWAQARARRLEFDRLPKLRETYEINT